MSSQSNVLCIYCIKAALSTIHWTRTTQHWLDFIHWIFICLMPGVKQQDIWWYKLSIYRLSFFLLFGLFAVFWGVGGGCPLLGKGLLALMDTGSTFLFLISGVRSARSFRRVSNLDASMAPSDLPDFPPAAPIPSNPSTNVSGSNYN